MQARHCHATLPCTNHNMPGNIIRLLPSFPRVQACITSPGA
jgi:hypothetical protein